MPRRTSSLRIFALVVAAICLSALLPAPGATRPAPGFTLPLLDGHTLSLASLQGSPILLLFWAPW